MNIGDKMKNKIIGTSLFLIGIASIFCLMAFLFSSLSGDSFIKSLIDILKVWGTILLFLGSIFLVMFGAIMFNREEAK